MIRYLLRGALVSALLWTTGSLAAQQRPIPLDTLQVTASSRASVEMATATRAVEVITAEQIRRLPARSVAEVLQWALGVDLMPRSPALFDVAVRGSSFEQVLVLVDGIRVSDAQTGHFDLNLAVPLDQVERIEILRGPASTLHGADAVGGVIQVVTRRAAGSSARIEGGSFGSAGLALGHGVGVGATRVDLGAELRRSSGHRVGTDYRIGMGRAALSAPLAGRTLRADLGYAARDFGADAFYAPFPSYEETRALTASLGWLEEGDSRLSVEPRLSLRRHDDDFTLKRAEPTFYRNQHQTQQAGGELMARFAAAPLLRLAGGVEAYRDQLWSATLGDRTESRGALLAEAAAGRLGQVTVTAGVRADWYQAFGWFTSPSAAAAWWPGAGVRLRGSLGRALRTPTWTERYYRDPANIGDPNLMPERAWSGEVGADAYPLAGVRLGVAGFVRSADDLIDWAKPSSTPGAPWQTRNVEDARFSGLETEAGIEELLGVRWTLRGSWLSVRSSEAQGFTSKYALRPLTESVSLSAERGLGRGVHAMIRAEHARRRGGTAYLRLDARAAYQLQRLRFFADLQNASGETYSDITGSAAPGRALFVGIEWRG